MQEMISIKEASALVGKVPLTVRRAIYKANDNMRSTDEKGRLLIDKEYIIEYFNVKPNEPIKDKVINDSSVISQLSNELNNKQLTINSLNDRLSETNMMLASQIQEINTLSTALIESNQLLLETKEPIIIDQPTVKKVFPLLEVISISVSAIFAGGLVYYLLNQ